MTWRTTRFYWNKYEILVFKTQVLKNRKVSLQNKYAMYIILIFRGVAQPGSASALGAEGREFESRRPDHITF